MTSLIEWADNLKKEENDLSNSNENIKNQENSNIKTIKCNNLLYNSYFSNIEYDFLNREKNHSDAEEQRESARDELLKLSRRFNLDLSPNMFYSRGKFIELLISSDTSKYCEFRMVSQIMTRNEHGIIEKVETHSSF